MPSGDARLARLEERLRGGLPAMHLPLRLWPESEIERLLGSPALLAMLTDVELDRIIGELEAMADD